MYLFFSLIVAIITHHKWFFSNAILSSGDWGFHYQETMISFLHPPYLWSFNGLGSVDLGLTTYPITLLWGIVGPLCGFGCAERMIYFFPSLIICVVSSYYLCKKITLSELPSAIGSLVYTYNTYFMIGRTGHMSLMVAFAIAPFTIHLIIRLSEKRSRYDILLLAITNILISIYEFRIWYILLVLELLALVYFNIDTSKKNLSVFLKKLSLPFLAIASTVIFNLYWLFGFSAGKSLSNNQFFSRGLFGDSFLTISNALTLFHPFWTGVQSSNFIVQPIPFYFWLIPCAAILGLYFNRNDKTTIFFGIVAILGIFLTKQSGIPFTHVYKFLYEHLPGFNAFREGSKFFFYVALGYSVLIAIFVKHILEKMIRRNILNKLYHIMLLSIVGIFLLNLKPVITGEIKTLFIPRHIPKEYISLKLKLKSDSKFYRTLWIPRESRWSYYSSTHPSVSISSVSPEIYFTKEGKIYDFISSVDFSKLLSLSSIKYVIVPLQDIKNDDDFFSFYESRESYINTLNKLGYLNKLENTSDGLYIYENKNYKDHIYSDGSQVSYTQLTAFHYDVHISDPINTKKLYLTDTYHQGWQLYRGNPSILKILMNVDAIQSKPEAINQYFHINSFLLLDPEDTYTLYFRPQIYIYMGLFTTLGICVVVIFIFILKAKLHNAKQ